MSPQRKKNKKKIGRPKGRTMGRAMSAKIPEELAVRLTDAAELLDRSNSWIVRAAIEQYLDRLEKQS